MAARRPARQRGRRIAVLRPVAVPSGASALSLLPLFEDVLAGGGGAVLPVPADDARQSSLLTTSLRAGERDRRRRCGGGFDVGHDGCAQGRDAYRVGVDGQCGSHTPQVGRSRPVAAGPAGLSRGRAAGAGAQRVAGTTPVAISAGFDAAELTSAVTSLGSGRRYASLVAAQLDKALGDPSAAAALASLDAVLIGGGPMPTALPKEPRRQAFRWCGRTG